jgi:hypothetical protein
MEARQDEVVSMWDLCVLEVLHDIINVVRDGLGVGGVRCGKTYGM